MVENETNDARVQGKICYLQDRNALCSHFKTYANSVDHLQQNVTEC